MSVETSQSVITPGTTIGILGSGQLGRMMAIAAKQMGYRVYIFSSESDSPAGQVADVEVIGDLKDLNAIKNFAQQVNVVTVETENIPTTTLEAAKEFVPAFPGSKALKVTQNRSFEKQFLADNDIPTCRFQIVRSLDELRDACASIMPGMLKTTTGGYDGKGKSKIETESDIESAWADLKAEEAILESWVDYEFEFSVVAARSSNGEFVAFPSIRNEHENQILDVSISPSGLSKDINAEAIDIVKAVMNGLDAVGVLTVEFFYENGKVLVNEIAPRPHNSGHLTIDAHETDQFEQHVRAICGLQLGSTKQLKPAAMVNLLGDEWEESEPRWHAALAMPGTKLHLYGKQEPRAKRKMGHLTATADSIETAVATAKGSTCCVR